MAAKLIGMLALSNAIEASLTIVNNKELATTAVVNGDQIVGFDGKVRKFKNMDDFVRALIEQNPYAQSVELSMSVAGVKTPKVPTDPVATAGGDIAKYTKLKTKAAATVAQLATKITSVAAWENNPIPAYAQAYADMVARKVALEAQVTYFDTIIAASQAIIDANDGEDPGEE